MVSPACLFRPHGHWDTQYRSQVRLPWALSLWPLRATPCCPPKPKTPRLASLLEDRGTHCPLLASFKPAQGPGAAGAPGRLLGRLPQRLTPPGPGCSFGGCPAKSPACRLPGSPWQRWGYGSSSSCSLSPRQAGTSPTPILTTTPLYR